MFLPLLSLILAQFGAGPSVEGTFNGTCLYPDAVRERAAAGELVTCNQVEISGDRIAFGLRSWQSQTVFGGTFEGDRMSVDTVTLANGSRHEVRGLCELYFANDKLSTVACTANGTRGAIAANFLVSRI